MAADPTKTHVTKTLAHTAPLLGCRFDPTGKFVFAGTEDNKVVRWDMATGTKTELAAHDSWIHALAFSANGETLISGGYDGRLVWWPATAEKPAPTRTIDAHQGWIRAIAVSPDGKLLATCGNDLKVKLWNLEDGALVREMIGHERHVYNVAFHPDGKQLASGDLTAKFIHWEVDTGNRVRDFAIASMTKYDTGFMADYGGPYCLQFTADGKRLVAGGITNVTNAFAGVGNPIIVEIDWESGKDAMTHLGKSAVNGKIFGLALHPEGFIIGASGGGAGGNLYFWKPDSKEEFHLQGAGNTCRDLSMHPDHLQLATCHHDKNVRIHLMAPKVA